MSEGNYSIISDYLGTPVEAFDEEGNRVWSAELDIYGRVNEFTGEKDFIPFRYQGQYDDKEVNLYYNRFRYYSPSEGIYTQQDPIGLEGNNPTLYGYIRDSNIEVDPLGLTNWSAFLRALNIPQPPGLTNPHGHHIVFKGVFKDKRGIYVKISQGILDVYKIGINDPSNLMWASNTKGVHTEANAKKVAEALMEKHKELLPQLSGEAEAFKNAQKQMKEHLQKVGEKVFSCY
ncbi:RHS repeat-associated core domain-containing protein [Lysinibacillus sp. JNUCC 51]|uniref:RHS repeat-associated core domain-containing protein n=1 Tax=Lysinibacillus sp. JNUCC-51 TaxID=2792479 RepID=UPI0019380A90|nr:AHH domain-containing protein [Lysinibacillus sp. JNUCC-51]